MSTGKYAAQKLVEFMDYVIDKGLINKETATSRRVSTAKVIEVLDETEKADLSVLDRESAFNRFQNLSSGKYTPQSLSVYRGRFNNTLDDFLRWADNPSGFKSALSGRQPRKAKPNGSKVPPSQIKVPEKPLSHTQDATHSVEREGFRLPIPLRSGVVVHISGLPGDLTPEEAKKISAIVSAYALTLNADKE